MELLILYSGNLGSTQKVAEMIAEHFDEVSLYDTSLKPQIDFQSYDVIIFGTNVRLERLNKNFIKYAKKYLRSQANAKTFVYVVGVDIEKSDAYVYCAKNLVKANKGFYVGGELNEEAAKGLVRSTIIKIKNSYLKNSLALPHLFEDHILELVNEIKKAN